MSLKDEIRKIGISGLAGIVLASNILGCTLITRRSAYVEGERERKVEILGVDKSSFYHISAFDRSPEEIGIMISEKLTETQHIKSYDEVPFYDEEVEIKEKITVMSCIATPIFYPIFSIVSLAGVPILIDSYELLRLRPKKTFFWSQLTGFEKREEKIISKERVKTEKMNEKNEEKQNYKYLPAQNISVRVSCKNPSLEGNAYSLLKSTDAQGRVVFRLVNQDTGDISIETLAEDGENEVKVLH